MNRIFIGVCGASASGKSTICKYLLSHFKNNAQIISQDAYYHDRCGLPDSEIDKINFDHPSSVDIDQLYQDLVQLRVESKVSIPQYCFKTHTRLKDRLDINVKKINIVEGLFVFETEKLRSVFDHKIYLSANH